MDKFKDRIRDFWNKKPCGTFGIIPENVDRDYFDNIKKRRYRLEPFIGEIAGFNKLKGKKVLEIGCGVGTDGVEFARSGAYYTGIDASLNSLELAKKNILNRLGKRTNPKRVDVELNKILKMGELLERLSF